MEFLKIIWETLKIFLQVIFGVIKMLYTTRIVREIVITITIIIAVSFIAGLIKRITGKRI